MSRLILPMIIITLLLCGCSSGNRQTEKILDRVESIIIEHPDSALYLLNQIDSIDIKGDRQKARHALLKTMALDKNFIDTSTFDVLQPAIDYYKDHGTPDEKLKTLFYQGRIYQYRGEKDQAMLCYLKALELKPFIHDSLTLGHLLNWQAQLFYETYRNSKYIKANLVAAEIYQKISEDYFAKDCFASAFGGAAINEDKPLLDSIVMVARSYYPDFYTPEGLWYDRMKYLEIINLGSPDTISEMLKTYNVGDSMSNDERLDIAEAYFKLGDSKNSMAYLNKAEEKIEVPDSLKYLLIKSDVYRGAGDYKTALEAFETYVIRHAIKEKEIYNQDLRFAEIRRLEELEHLQKLRRKDTALWVSIGGAFFVLVLSILLYYRNRYLKTEVRNREMEVRNKEMENSTYRLLYENLEREREELQDILSRKNELEDKLRDFIAQRLEFLQNILIHIDSKGKSTPDRWKILSKALNEDRIEFLSSIHTVIRAMKPELMEYLEKKGLTEEEINFLSLFLFGMKGKDLRNYMSEFEYKELNKKIRRKLGIEDKTYLRNYIRELSEELRNKDNEE